MPRLGVNIDHIATLREARGGEEPIPAIAAKICVHAGADSIVAHLREDRRHIQDKDIRDIRKNIRGRFNLEMALDPKIVRLAASVRPDQVTFVPEKRQELTTEGGLNVVKSARKIKQAVKTLQKKNIEISLFIDPVKTQIKKARDIGIKTIELHTGKYANAKSRANAQKELSKLKNMTEYALSMGLTVSAGHGLNYLNVKPVAAIRGIEELNIGHAIIARSISGGLGNAVREMQSLIS